MSCMPSACKHKEKVLETLYKENQANNAKNIQELENNYILQIKELKELPDKQKSLYETQRHLQATNDAIAVASRFQL